MRAIWSWLISEAGAGWIIGTIGIALSVYTWLKRGRPARVLIRELQTNKLLDVHPSQRDKIKIRYIAENHQEAAIESLQQKTFVIYNAGTVDISEPLSIGLLIGRLESTQKARMSSPVGLVQWIFDDPTCRGTFEATADPSQMASSSLEIPYLNAYGAHRHCVRAYLLSEHDLKISIAKGTGKGWSAILVSQAALSDMEQKTQKAVRTAMRVAVLLLLVLSVALTLNHPLIQAYLGHTNENTIAGFAFLRALLMSKFGAWGAGFWVLYIAWVTGAAIGLLAILLYALAAIIKLPRRLAQYLVRHRLWLDRKIEAST